DAHVRALEDGPRLRARQRLARDRFIGQRLKRKLVHGSLAAPRTGCPDYTGKPRRRRSAAGGRSPVAVSANGRVDLIRHWKNRPDPGPHRGARVLDGKWWKDD